MITLLDIQKAISKKIYLKFGDEYFNYVEEIKKDMKRPAFFIDIMPIQINNFVDYTNKLINVDITYFSKYETLHNNKIVEENLDMIDSLQGLFESTLQVKDNIITILSTNFKTIDDIMHCSFTLDFTDCVDETIGDITYMEELIINNESEE